MQEGRSLHGNKDGKPQQSVKKGRKSSKRHFMRQASPSFAHRGFQDIPGDDEETPFPRSRPRSHSSSDARYNPYDIARLLHDEEGDSEDEEDEDEEEEDEDDDEERFKKKLQKEVAAVNVQPGVSGTNKLEEEEKKGEQQQQKKEVWRKKAIKNRQESASSAGEEEKETSGHSDSDTGRSTQRVLSSDTSTTASSSDEKNQLQQPRASIDSSLLRRQVPPPTPSKPDLVTSASIASESSHASTVLSSSSDEDGAFGSRDMKFQRSSQRRVKSKGKNRGMLGGEGRHKGHNEQMNKKVRPATTAHSPAANSVLATPLPLMHSASADNVVPLAAPPPETSYSVPPSPVPGILEENFEQEVLPEITVSSPTADKSVLLPSKGPTAVSLTLDSSTDGDADDDTPSIQLSRPPVYVFGETMDIDEDWEHEFKAVSFSHHPLDSIAEYVEKYMIAFLNSSGGTIYFGIEDDGTIRGIMLNRKERDNLRLRVDALVSSFRPQVDPYLWRLSFVPVDLPAGRGRRSDRNRDWMKEEKQKYEERSQLAVGDMGRKRSKSVTSADSVTSQPKTLEELPTRFVVELRVSKGRAPVYLTRAGVGFIRLSGSTHKMDADMILERQSRGRPYNLGGGFAPPRDFIGREEEIAKIRSYIRHTRARPIVVLLYGHPCLGKSALARRLLAEFSSSFPDGQFLIDLKGINSHYLKITDAMITVIRMNFPQMTLPEEETQLQGLYHNCFIGRRTILLIENCGSVDQIQQLAPLGAVCLVLVTSRKALALDVEMDNLSIRLTELKENDSVKLMRTLVPRISLDQAREISRLCGNMPLPLKLVASTLATKPNITPQSIIEKLQHDEQRLELVQSTLEASFQLYPDELKDLLTPISLFVGSFEHRATAFVLAKGYSETENSLGLLLEYSLLEYDSVTSRYWQNDLLRLYITAKIKDQVEVLRMYEGRFVRYYTHLLVDMANIASLKTQLLTPASTAPSAISVPPSLDESSNSGVISVPQEVGSLDETSSISPAAMTVVSTITTTAAPSVDTLPLSKSQENTQELSTVTSPLPVSNVNEPSFSSASSFSSSSPSSDSSAASISPELSSSSSSIASSSSSSSSFSSSSPSSSPSSISLELSSSSSSLPTSSSVPSFSSSSISPQSTTTTPENAAPTTWRAVLFKDSGLGTLAGRKKDDLLKVFILERKNIDACFTYAAFLRDSDLTRDFIHAMSDMIGLLDVVERKRYEKQLQELLTS